MIDHIDEVLTNYSLDNKLVASVRVACELAKKTLNRYYKKTDDSEMYRIAMGKCSCYLYFCI